MSDTDDSPFYNIASLEALIALSYSYAGIGARRTPPSIRFLMTRLASMLADAGLTLRSGASPGADRAFEEGCNQRRGRKEIFLPWQRFGKHGSPYFTPPDEAFELAARLHPNWSACPPVARKLHARDCQLVLGERLDAPVRFVLFWAGESEGPGAYIEGRTATAVSLARERNIPTFNLENASTRALWEQVLERDEEKRFLAWRRLLRSLIEPRGLAL